MDDCVSSPVGNFIILLGVLHKKVIALCALTRRAVRKIENLILLE